MRIVSQAIKNMNVQQATYHDGSHEVLVNGFFVSQAHFGQFDALFA